MMTVIPPKVEVPQDKPRKFLIQTPMSVYLALQNEAASRDVDLLTLGGSVLSAWVFAGCPDSFFDIGSEQLASE